MKRHGKRILLVVLIILLFMGGIRMEFHRSTTKLIVTNYMLKEKTTSPIRIVFLADLHNTIFGENNSELINGVRVQKPDLIFMAGDMCNGDEEDIGIVISLVGYLSEIAPVYFSYGNHEKEWEERYHRDLSKIIEEAGAVVLDREYTDVTIRNVPLRIGGYYGYYRAPVMVTSDYLKRQEDITWCEDFEDTTRIKLLLCHIPTAFLDWEHRDEYNAGLAFCGHYHGGQIRLPMIGGVVAPNVGLFPKYTKGMFSGKGTDVILTTGLGSEYWIPRFNNPPEIAVVDLKPKE